MKRLWIASVFWAFECNASYPKELAPFFPSKSESNGCCYFRIFLVFAIFAKLIAFSLKSRIDEDPLLLSHFDCLFLCYSCIFLTLTLTFLKLCLCRQNPRSFSCRLVLYRTHDGWFTDIFPTTAIATDCHSISQPKVIRMIRRYVACIATDARIPWTNFRIPSTKSKVEVRL